MLLDDNKNNRLIFSGYWENGYNVHYLSLVTQEEFEDSYNASNKLSISGHVGVQLLELSSEK